jgi:hypothetical protein
MNLETRLARCIAYRDEAMKQPELHPLYIEDLNLTIKMLEGCIAKTPLLADGKPIIDKGWSDDE